MAELALIRAALKLLRVGIFECTGKYLFVNDTVLGGILLEVKNIY